MSNAPMTGLHRLVVDAFSGRVLVIAAPFLFLLVFFLGPFFIVGKISVSEMEAVTFKDLVTWSEGVLTLSLKFGTYQFIAQDPLYWQTYVNSVKYAGATTLLCLFIGYPFAYFMARAKSSIQPALLMLVMLPFWTSFLLRVYSWRGLLTEGGWVAEVIVGVGLDQLLYSLGLITAPGKLMHTPFSLVLGMTYTYLPFMILPIQAAVERIPGSYIEASSDLGARPGMTFFKVILPLALPGIAAGSIFTFSLTLGDYIIPQVIGDSTMYIGQVVYKQQGVAGNVPFAAAFSLVPIVVIGAWLWLARRLGAFDAH
jgi:putrescine transport system permease protein